MLPPADPTHTPECAILRRAEPGSARAPLVAGALLVASLGLWTLVGLRYAELSAVPLRPGPLLLHVGLLTLGHSLIGSALLGLLARRDDPPRDAWAWCILLGYGAAPAILWSSDRLGGRTIGWGLLALLVLAGLVLELRRVARRRGARASADPRASRDAGPTACSRAIPLLALLACLGGAALFGLDHIVYLRPDPQGVALTPPEDNLVHTAFALEWTRQQPYRHLLQAFTPENVGIAYHYLTDVQLASWWTLCGGEALELVQRERFLLEGFAFLLGIYLFAKAVLESTGWALLASALLSVVPFWFVDLAGIPQRECIQRLWISFTFQNGAAFGAAFLAAAWPWLVRGRTSLARAALVFAGFVFLAKVYFALLAWAAAAALLVYLRPRGWLPWLAGLVLVGLAILALQPHGADVLAMRPVWAPGRFWNDLLADGGPPSPDGRALPNFLDWIGVGLSVLAAGALGAALAFRRAWPRAREGRALIVLVAAGWCAYLVHVSLFWFLDTHQTGFQFLPWLAVVSIVVGLAGLRAAWNHAFGARPRAAARLAWAGVVLWLFLVARAWATTDGFAQSQWPKYPFSNDSWKVLSFLRTQTPATARVLGPFESPLLAPLPSPYAISGVAERRAVDEHFNLAIWFPGLAERVAERKKLVAQFYADPRPELLRTLSAAWELDYAVVPARRAARLLPDFGETVFTTTQWIVLRVGARPAPR